MDLLLKKLPSFVGCASSFTSDGVQSALACGVHIEERGQGKQVQHCEVLGCWLVRLSFPAGAAPRSCSPPMIRKLKTIQQNSVLETTHTVLTQTEPTPNSCLRIIQSTFWDDRFPVTAIAAKTTKYHL